MRKIPRSLVWVLGAALLVAPTAASAVCVGDCDGSGDVSIDEVITMVNISLGSAPVSNCTAGDPDGNGQVDITEVIQAVNNALNGCPSAPSPTSTGGAPAATPTPSPTSPPTLTPTITATPTAVSLGPVVTYFGLASAEGYPLTPTATDAQGRAVYTSLFGFGVIVVIESKPGADGQPAGTQFFNSDPNNPAARPDLQLLPNQNLDNGSAAVCDVGPLPDFPLGGVPGIDPPTFDPASQTVANILNDFGCRFADNTFGQCTFDAGGNFAFVAPDSTKQFCTSIVLGREMRFPSGDTLLTVQLRDGGRNLGLPAQIVVRVPQT